MPVAGAPESPDNPAIRETRDYIKKLEESSRRLERWSKVLIALTIVLAVQTGYLIFVSLSV
ncbi:MAG: hypothetical protein V3U49_01260 [Nitrososphaerales archaeon]